jgi:hypothetical protein
MNEAGVPGQPKTQGAAVPVHRCPELVSVNRCNRRLGAREMPD